MVPGLVVLLLGVTLIFTFVMVKTHNSRNPGPLKNHASIFAYYNMGYDEQGAGRPKTNWDKILDTKYGLEKTKAAREIRAYCLGYEDASNNKPRLTEQITETSEENNQLWKEWNDRLD